MDRQAALQELAELACRESQLLVIGPPGSGKSWSLDALRERARAEGHLVATHYCYISLEDTDMERRAQVQTMFGSLVAELLDADQNLTSHQFPRYSAGPEELERLVETAVKGKPDQRVFLIVDGLDHASRIRPGPIGAPQPARYWRKCQAPPVAFDFRDGSPWCRGCANRASDGSGRPVGSSNRRPRHLSWAEMISPSCHSGPPSRYSRSPQCQYEHGAAPRTHCCWQSAGLARRLAPCCWGGQRSAEACGNATARSRGCSRSRRQLCGEVGSGQVSASR